MRALFEQWLQEAYGNAEAHVVGVGEFTAGDGYDFSLGIEHGSSAVAGVDGGVCLDAVLSVDKL